MSAFCLQIRSSHELTHLRLLVTANPPGVLSDPVPELQVCGAPCRPPRSPRATGAPNIPAQQNTGHSDSSPSVPWTVHEKIETPLPDTEALPRRSSDAISTFISPAFCPRILCSSMKRPEKFHVGSTASRRLPSPPPHLPPFVFYHNPTLCGVIAQ